MTEAARTALVRQVDAEVAAVAGTGFHVTPFERADALSEALGFSGDGGVWIKDETGQVAGSHKARHLLTILLHLLTAESIGLAPWAHPSDRPPLAIASCGNAAFAAATLAAAVEWPLRVFVPPNADPAVVKRFGELRADVVECPRRTSDPAGDPCIHRFREAVAAGAIPFTVQGTENAWCLDGGRTIGWEMAGHFDEQVVGPPLDRLFIQVGAGTFAACAIAGFRMSGVMPRLHAVQTDSCAPLSGHGTRRSGWAVRLRPPRTGASACGHGNTSATRSPMESSTTRPTTGSRLSGRWAMARARRSSPRPVLEANELGPAHHGDQRLAHRDGGPGRLARSVTSRGRPTKRRSRVQRSAEVGGMTESRTVVAKWRAEGNLQEG